jgi:hypothetical protein
MKSKAGTIITPLAVLVPVLVVALASLPRNHEPAPLPVDREQCTATLDPDSVVIQQEPITIAFAVPDSMGKISNVVAPDDSGIRVGNINPDEGTVGINTSGAAEGDWTLDFQNAEQLSCPGVLNVRTADGGHR